MPKPIPWHLADTEMLDKINQKKTLRRKKIATENKMRMFKEWKTLPNAAQEFSEPSDSFIPESEEIEKEKKSKVKEVSKF